MIAVIAVLLLSVVWEGVKMGLPVRLVVDDLPDAVANTAITAALREFDAVNAAMSDYDPESEVSLLSHRAVNGSVVVSDSLAEVLLASKKYAALSDGAFDVTVAPLVKLWRRARREGTLPTTTQLADAQERVGDALWEIDAATRSVRLLRPGVRFDLGGIAKGFAIDCAFEAMQKYGSEAILVDAGGDVRVGAAPASSPRGWRLGVAPFDSDGAPCRTIWATRISLATSGNTARFVEIDGVRYSHIVDPKTGYGVTHHAMVTVAAPKAIDADALASAVSVLGTERGLDLVDRCCEDSKDIAVMVVEPSQSAHLDATESAARLSPHWYWDLEHIQNTDKKGNEQR